MPATPSVNPSTPTTPLKRPTLASIVATVGPASRSPEMIAKLIHAGATIFRLNFSHGTLDEHAAQLKTIRQVAKDLRATVAVLGDLQGPKIRLGKFGRTTLAAGQEVYLIPSSHWASFASPTLATENPPPIAVGESRPLLLPCDYEPITREVEPGHRVLINDGAVRLLAIGQVILSVPAVDRPTSPESKSEGPVLMDTPALHCTTVIGGEISDRKGINLPDTEVSAPAITDQDWRCVEWAVAHDLDFLALSFVRHAAEVLQLKEALAGLCPVASHAEDEGEGARIPVIAKIEKPQALLELDAIVDAADAIMVARGDLGVEMDLPEVPLVQKRLIAAADRWGKPCIVATQMLESMIQSHLPTRAEVSDVSHAILDGADAVMLSAETAAGKHPDLAALMMRRIVEAAERHLAAQPQSATPSVKLMESRYRTAALAHGAWYTARDLGARAIVCWSQRGGTARYLSQTGTSIPILAYSSHERQTRRMALLRGVTPVLAENLPQAKGAGDTSLAAWNRLVDADLIERGWAAPGDPIILLAGEPLGSAGATTRLAAHFVGNPATGFMAGGPG